MIKNEKILGRFSNLYAASTECYASGSFLSLPHDARKSCKENGPFDLFLGNIKPPGYHFGIGIELRAIVLLLTLEPGLYIFFRPACLVGLF